MYRRRNENETGEAPAACSAARSSLVLTAAGWRFPLAWAVSTACRRLCPAAELWNQKRRLPRRAASGRAARQTLPANPRATIRGRHGLRVVRRSLAVPACLATCEVGVTALKTSTTRSSALPRGYRCWTWCVFPRVEMPDTCCLISACPTEHPSIRRNLLSGASPSAVVSSPGSPRPLGHHLPPLRALFPLERTRKIARFPKKFGATLSCKVRQ